MTTDINTSITRALQQAVIAAVAASDDSSIPIKALGKIQEIPNDQKYLEIVLIRDDRTNDYWGNSKVFQGILRLILHWPNENTGVYDPSDLIGSIAGYFTKDKTFTSGQASVKIYEVPNMGDQLEAGNELLFPVSIRYRCFVSN